MDNVAYSTNFLFTTTGSRNISAKVQSTNIASIALGVTPFGTRYKDDSIPGDKIEYDDINVIMILSETLSEWMEIVKWLISLKNNPDVVNDIFQTISITVLDSNGKGVIEVVYYNAWPTNIDDINYATNAESNAMTCTVSFKYEKLKIRNLITGEEVDDEFIG